MDMLAPAIQQVILEGAVSVHGVIKVPPKSLELMRAIRIGLDFTLVEGVGLLEVDPADVAAVLELVAVLYFGNFFDGFDPEVIFVEV